MRQLLSILFLILSLAIQCSKQLNYLQCKIANIGKSTAPKCDCENQGKQLSENNSTTPPVKASAHFYLDDYYSVSNYFTTQVEFIILTTKKDTLNEHTCSGDTNELFRPPRC